MKKTIDSEYRVVVWPDTKHLAITTDNGHIEQMCESIKQSIERHVDHVGSVERMWTSRDVCSFCGREWEEHDQDFINPDSEKKLLIGDNILIEGLPVCCDAAITEFFDEHFQTDVEDDIIKIVLDRMAAADIQREQESITLSMGGTA